MVVGDHDSNDTPARDGAVAGRDQPRRRDSEGSGAGPADQVPARDNEKPVTSDSSDDGNHAKSESEHDIELAQPGSQAPEPCPDGPQLSRPASSFANTNNIIPRAERRGLLGRFALIPEIERPYEYRNSTKWAITAIVALAGAAAPMGSSIFLREFWHFALGSLNSWG